VIRRLDPAVADRLGPMVQLAETRAFFAPRAATGEDRFLALAQRVPPGP
jgi:hypothetical protein